LTTEKKTILIIGASGKVGKILFNTLRNDNYGAKFETYGTYNTNPVSGLHHLDMTNRDSVKEIFGKITPRIVIQPAALTYAEAAEENKEYAAKINIEGTKNVAECCKLSGAKLVYISSDYVYDGENGPFSENSITKPTNYFGQTKVEAEKLVLKLEDSLVIRTAWVNDISVESKSFVMQLITSLLNNKQMRVPTDQYGHPTLAQNLVEIIIDLILKNKSGIYNVAGTTFIDRYSLAVKLAEAFSLDPSLVVGVASEELKQKARRPKKVSLNLDKLKANVSVKILNLEEQIDQMRKMYSLTTPIEGVKLVYLGSYRDGRGALTVLVSQGRKDAPDAAKIQEVYLSEIPEPKIVRAGHKHLKTDEFFYVLDGSAKFELVDDRQTSATFKNRCTFFLNSRYLSTLFVPAGIYHALVSLEENSKVLAIASKAYHKDDTDTYNAPANTFQTV